MIFMTKTAKKKANKKAKRIPTIAMMSVDVGKNTAAKMGKWRQGAYRARQINRMESEGISPTKAVRVANRNAGY